MTRAGVRDRLWARRGGVYVAVMGLATLLAALAITALASARIRNHTSAMNDDVIAARRYAETAIELGRFAILNDASWRSNYSQGDWFTRSAFDSGAISLAASSTSGSFKTSELESVTFTGIGERQSARQIVQATFVPVPAAMTSLQTAISARGNVSVGLLATLNATGQTVYSGGSVSANVSTVRAYIEYTGSCTGLSYIGVIQKAATARQIPDSAVALKDYLSKATTIPLASIPKSFGTYIITRTLLSPAVNPYGTVNTQGIYRIDCAGQKIEIYDCRIVGTLILINPGSGSSINGSVSIEPAVANQPSLLIDGAMTFNLSSTTLKENTSVNFNPIGTPFPYPLGAVDADKTDTYASKITGFVYVNGNVTLSGNTTMSQVITTGAVSISGTVTLTPEDAPFINPPSGFRTFSYVPAVNGYVRVVDP